MSEELCYSTVVFTTPQNFSGEDTRPVGQETRPSTSPEKTVGNYQFYKWSTLVLSLICGFLLAGITALAVSYSQSLSITGQIEKYDKALINAKQELRDLNNTLTAQKQSLERDIAELEIDRALLLGIFQIKNFSVDQYCPITNSSTNERTCSPCPNGWQQHNSKCYSPYLSDDGWKTWYNSRYECLRQGADLVMIQNEEEQKFIQKLAVAYFDKWHGYWIGLNRDTNVWIWLNGTALTKGFWANSKMESQNGKCVLTNTYDNNLNSWNAVPCSMLNRWICEKVALIF